MISINLTTHNHAYMLDRVIDGIRSNAVLPYELVVVIDGCTDDTEAVVARAKPTKVLRTPDVFETKANNVAARASEGEFIVIVQDDCIITEKGWDERLVKPLKAYDDVWSCSGNCSHNWRVQNPHALEVPDDPSRWCDLLTCTERAAKGTIHRDTVAIRDTCNRGPLALKHSIFQRLGHFDEAFAPQDMDDHDANYRAYTELGMKACCYWIGFESDLAWAGTRANGADPPWLLASHWKNCRILWERHHDLIAGPKHDENRRLP